jgi:hypothetical protein
MASKKIILEGKIRFPVFALSFSFIAEAGTGANQGS